MSLIPLTERQKTLIVNNVVKSVKNIDSLNKTGYNFLYLASGFIAHSNLNGFITFYRHISLQKDPLCFAISIQWQKFSPA